MKNFVKIVKGMIAAAILGVAVFNASIALKTEKSSGLIFTLKALADGEGGGSGPGGCPDYNYVPNRFIVAEVQTIEISSNSKGEINIGGDCAEKPQTDSDMIVFKQDQIETIDKIPFVADEFIDSCIFVRLETSDISLIGVITQLATFEGDFYIYDQQTKKIKVFDQTGKFLRDIGKLGQGPQEYLSISAFVINPKERKIAKFDPAKKTSSNTRLMVLIYDQSLYPTRNVHLSRKQCMRAITSIVT